METCVAVTGGAGRVSHPGTTPRAPSSELLPVRTPWNPCPPRLSEGTFGAHGQATSSPSIAAPSPRVTAVRLLSPSLHFTSSRTSDQRSATRFCTRLPSLSERAQLGESSSRSVHSGRFFSAATQRSAQLCEQAAVADRARCRQAPGWLPAAGSCKPSCPAHSHTGLLGSAVLFYPFQLFLLRHKSNSSWQMCQYKHFMRVRKGK